MEPSELVRKVGEMTLSIVRCEEYEWTLPVPSHQRTHGGVIFLRSGYGSVTVAEAELDVGPGDIVVYLPLEAHAYAANEGDTLRATMLTFELHGDTGDLDRLGERRRFSALPGVSSMLDFIRAAASSENEYALRAAERVAAGLLYRLVAECAFEPVRPRANPVDAAMEMLFETHTARLNHVASELGVSTEAIRKQFRKHFGDSPMHYFTGYHVHRLAAVLEHTDSTLRELAEQFGFYDEFHLSRVFKRYMGVSPAEYRRQQRD